MADAHAHKEAHTPNDLADNFSLSCALWQRAPPPHVCALLKQCGGGTASPESQRALLAEWRRPSAQLLPPSADYRRRVLRAVVLEAEQQGQEVCEELMQLYSECLLAQPGSMDNDLGLGHGVAFTQPGWCFKLYAYAPSAAPLAAVVERLAALESQAWSVLAYPQQQQQQQRRPHQGGQVHRGAPSAAAVTRGDCRHGLLALHVSLNLLEGGTGCHEWEAGFFLAEWVLSHPELVAGRCCLELGCGVGMTGVALHRAGAAGIILTDGDAATLDNCRLNLQLNGVPLAAAGGPGAEGRPGADCCLLRWEERWRGVARQPAPSVVLGADLLYDPTAIPPLLSMLKQVLAAAAAEAAAAAQTTAAAALDPAGSPAPPAAAAYLVTTLRNEATLQQFLRTAREDPEVRLEELRGAGGVAAACGDGASAGGGDAAEVTFKHLPELEAARRRIFLHRITLAPPYASLS